MSSDVGFHDRNCDGKYGGCAGAGECCDDGFGGDCIGSAASCGVTGWDLKWEIRMTQCSNDPNAEVSPLARFMLDAGVPVGFWVCLDPEPSQG